MSFIEMRNTHEKVEVTEETICSLTMCFIKFAILEIQFVY